MEQIETTQTKRSEETKPTEDKGKRTIPRHPDDLKLAEKVRDIKIIWPEVDEETKTFINRSILARLRSMDYVARQKLMLLMTGLHIEQCDDRQESRRQGKLLCDLIPLIEDIEETIAQEDFDQELTTAVFNLPQDEQEKLLRKLEAEQEATEG